MTLLAEIGLEGFHVHVLMGLLASFAGQEITTGLTDPRTATPIRPGAWVTGRDRRRRRGQRPSQIRSLQSSPKQAKKVC